ncbi:MAG TPA: hypothetical protein VHL53_05675 [Acidimicrobiia bacterium]|nr:hypothetical protein [Acidimicrobiia bacterium]
MFRTLTVGVLGLAVGLGLGLTSRAGADSPKPAVVSTAKTPASCLLALEAGWKTINQTPTGTDSKAEFDSAYAQCLQES